MKKLLSEMTLEELWALFPIMLKEYDPSWEQWYKEEAQMLRTIFFRDIARIRHIGSTSVPGMTAKPTVDILLEVTKDSFPERLRTLGREAGYVVMSETLGGEYSLDMCKGYTLDGFAERVFHLHIRYLGDWDEPYFCAYLREHSDCAAAYVKLKMELQKKYEHNRDAYTEAKGDFIRKWTAIARQKTI